MKPMIEDKKTEKGKNENRRARKGVVVPILQASSLAIQLSVNEKHWLHQSTRVLDVRC